MKKITSRSLKRKFVKTFPKRGLMGVFGNEEGARARANFYKKEGFKTRVTKKKDFTGTVYRVFIKKR